MRSTILGFSHGEVLLASTEKNIIYIYNGPGAFQDSIKHAEYTFKKFLPSHYFLKRIDCAQVKSGDWIKDAKLFVMPGGIDSPYAKYLGFEGGKKIKDFVSNGGLYLGICGGAYYGSNKINFALNTPLEVRAIREHAFFPGIANGPILAPFNYNTNDGVRVAKIRCTLTEDSLLQGKEILTYYNGGCYFENAHAYKDVKILAEYSVFPDRKPAIVEIIVGNGKAILSGIHCEYAPELLDDTDPLIKPIKRELLDSDSDRKKLMQYIIECLGFNIQAQPGNDLVQKKLLAKSSI